jgi:hypothetical protein
VNFSPARVHFSPAGADGASHSVHGLFAPLRLTKKCVLEGLQMKGRLFDLPRTPQQRIARAASAFHSPFVLRS